MPKKIVITTVIAIIALCAFIAFLYQRTQSAVSVSYPPGTKMPEPINIVPTHRNSHAPAGG
jgi:hypothetical protein